MAYKVWIGSVAIDCDTADEALELARRAEGETAPSLRARHSENTGNEGSRWNEKRAQEFFRLIEGKQRKLIDALIEHKDGRTDEQLRQLLSLDNGKQLAGVFTGMWKNAKKVGADPGELYIRKPVSIGGKRIHEYFLTDSFRNVASQAAKP